MNNRQIIDYILSNKLKENDVIKRIEKYKDYDDESIMYLFNDRYHLYDDNGEVGIFSFCDEKPNLNGNIMWYYTYEIISKEQAYKEIEEKERNKKIKELEKELKRLKEDK